MTVTELIIYLVIGELLGIPEICYQALPWMHISNNCSKPHITNRNVFLTAL